MKQAPGRFISYHENFYWNLSIMQFDESLQNFMFKLWAAIVFPSRSQSCGTYIVILS